MLFDHISTKLEINYNKKTGKPIKTRINNMTLNNQWIKEIKGEIKNT